MKINYSQILKKFPALVIVLSAMMFSGEIGQIATCQQSVAMAQTKSKTQQPPATQTPPQSPTPPDLVHFGEPDKNQAWTLRQRDNGNILDVHVLGEIRFTEDYRNIQSISRNGYFRLEEQRGAMMRTYEVRPDSEGHLRAKYEVQRNARPLDTEAQTWLGDTILEIVRQNGLDAEARVQHLLRSGGVRAVRDEITRINNDYAKSRYFEELVKSGKPDTATLTQVERQLSGEVKNDYYKALVFVAIARWSLDNDANLPSFFETVGTLGNDYYWARVLDAVLQRDKLSRAALVSTLKSASNISSDYEKARVMLRVAAAATQDSALRTSLLDAAKTINSEYERNRVLAAMVTNEKQH